MRPAGDEVEHRGRVDRDHVADEADVDVLAVDPGGAAGRGEQPGVLAGHPHRERAVGVDQPDELAADLPDQHHPDDVHGLGRGDPQPAAELPGHVEPLEHGGDLRPAAVDDDGADAGEAQEHHVLGEGAPQVVVDHRVAAVLDDDDRVLELAQPRQGLGEHRGLGLRLLRGGGGGAGRGQGHVEYALFSST